MHTPKLFLPHLLLLGALALAGCQADAMEDETALLTLELEAVVGTRPLSTDPATVYTIQNRNLTFTSARMYVSEITLLRQGGAEIAITGAPVTAPAKNEADETVAHTTNDRIVLARHDLGEKSFALGEVPVGVYEGVRFKVGLAGLTNRIDPTQVPDGHPLAKQVDRNNHWSWNAGYLFLRMDGLLDLDGDGAVEATPEAAWNVHLGTTAFLQTVLLDEPFTLEPGEQQALHLIVDYAKLIQDIDFGNPAERICHTMNNLPVARKVAEDIGGAFLLHGIHHAH